MALCQHLVSISAGQSPFVRLLVTGYYDGPTDGFAACRFCDKSYFFRLLSWDDGQDLRIFGLAGLDESFAQIFAKFHADMSVSQNVILMKELTLELENELEGISKCQTEVVVASRDLVKEVVAFKLGGDGHDSEFDWFSWLGVKK